MRTCVFAILAVVFAVVTAETFFLEKFDNANALSRWTQSKSRSDYGNLVLSSGAFYGDKAEAQGLKTSQDARFYSISAPLDKQFTNENQDLVLQFSVKHEQGIDCGGGYIKLLYKGLDQTNFNGDSQYAVMFGPDVCGSDRKIHLIFNYKGNNLLWKKKPSFPNDKLTHVYTLTLHPDNTYKVLVDNELRESGNLADDWDFLPPKEIADPEAKKPVDWVDEKEIVDPEDKKPADWDDAPEYIPDPDAQKPDDWNDEEDGEWERPQIKNPEYKGEWQPRRIPNPAYKGEWKAPLIPNPDYKADDKLYLHKDMAFVGFDLWQVKSGTIFDNVIVTNSLEEAKELLNETYLKNKDAEKAEFDKFEPTDIKKPAEAPKVETMVEPVDEIKVSEHEREHDEL